MCVCTIPTRTSTPTFHRLRSDPSMLPLTSSPPPPPHLLLPRMNRPSLVIALFLILPYGISSDDYFAAAFESSIPRLFASRRKRNTDMQSSSNSNLSTNSYMQNYRVASRRPLYLSSDDNGGADKRKNPRDDTAIIGGELVTALARLDKEWKLARHDSGKKIGDWTILELNGDDDNNNNSDEEAVASSSDFL